MKWALVAGSVLMATVGFCAGWAMSDWQVVSPLKLKLLTGEKAWAEERELAATRLAQKTADYRNIEQEAAQALGVLAAGHAEKERELEKARGLLADWPGRVRQRPTTAAAGVPGTTQGGEAPAPQACEDRLPGIREAFEDVAAETGGAAAALIDAQQLLADFDYVVAVADACPAFSSAQR